MRRREGEGGLRIQCQWILQHSNPTTGQPHSENVRPERAMSYVHVVSGVAVIVLTLVGREQKDQTERPGVEVKVVMPSASALLLNC